MKLIVRAADYAMTDSITDGCLKAIRDGILTDVGLMTNNAEHAQRAVREVPEISACLHWSGLEFSFRNPRVPIPA